MSAGGEFVLAVLAGIHGSLADREGHGARSTAAARRPRGISAEFTTANAGRGALLELAAAASGVSIEHYITCRVEGTFWCR